MILFWASWCIPCRAELARLPAIRAAARPLPVVTLALDDAATARATLVRYGLLLRDAFADPRPPKTVLAEWNSTGLPLAVAVDHTGRPCGSRHGLLGTDQLKQWAHTCSR